MTRDPLILLREAKPAADPHDLPPAELLFALTAMPRPAAAARLRAPRRLIMSRFGLVVASAALASGVLAVVSTLGGSTSVGPDLAAQAYANTDASIDVIYTRQRLSFRSVSHVGTPGVSPGDFVEEEWRRGDTVHTITYVNGRVDGDTVTRGTKIYSRDPQTGAISTSRSIPANAELLPGFREAYRGHKLRDRGAAVFAGRKVRSYVVVKHDVARRLSTHGIPGRVTHTTETMEYFLDPKMRLLRGSRETIVSRSGAHHSEHVLTQTVEVFRKTPSTPAALAALSFHPIGDGSILSAHP